MFLILRYQAQRSLQALPLFRGPVTQHFCDDDGHPVSQNLEHLPFGQHVDPWMHDPAQWYDSIVSTEWFFVEEIVAYFYWKLSETLTNRPCNGCNQEDAQNEWTGLHD